MTSFVALVAGDFEPGAIVPIDRYLVDPQALWKLGHGGALYLVADGPNDALYLVAVLEQPERARIKKGDTRPDGWYAAANTVPVTEVSRLRGALATVAKPRALTARQEAALRAVFDDGGDAPVLAASAGASVRAAQIDELLAIWRRTRAREVADAIERATRLLPRYDRPLLLDARDERASHARWLAAWEHERAEAMPQLLRDLFMPPNQLLPARLAAIAAGLPDPRAARYLARRIRDLDRATRDPWIQIVRESLDPAAWETITNVLPEFDENVMPTVVADLQALRVAPHRVTLAAQDLARVRAIEATLVEDPAEARLVDAIAEHPDEDEPFLIYSDWLLERGHPRGEYIALACQRQRGKLSPALARRLAALEGVPHLFGGLDEIATQQRRPRPRGIDRELVATWTHTSPTWTEASHAPLVRALETLTLYGIERETRIPGLVAFVRAAPRLRQIDGASGPVARELAKVLGWRTDVNGLVRG